MNHQLRFLVAASILVLSATISSSAQEPDPGGRALRNSASSSLGFEPNVGQLSQPFQFGTQATGYSVYLGVGEMVMVLRSKNKDERRGDVIRISLVGADKMVDGVGVDLLPGVSHYYIGNDPAQWKTDVRRFRQVRYAGLYPGVDFICYGNQQQMEFDFTVAPRRDVSRIDLKFEGATVTRRGDDLQLTTKSGNTAILNRPRLYQGEGRTRRNVSGGYVLRRANEVGFKVGHYDRQQPLVIDPGLVYSTFATALMESTVFKGQSNPATVPEADRTSGIAADSNGSAYITGEAITTDPNTVPPSVIFRAFVVKFDPAGSSIVYSTYLGGNSNNSQRATIGLAINLDSTASAYVGGLTDAIDFPTTAGAFSTIAACANGGLNVDCVEPFAFKLDSTGKLVYSTFLVKGTPTDTAGPVPAAIAVDANGALYMTGVVSPSRNFPGDHVTPLGTTLGAFQPARKNDSSAFVLKLHPGGSGLDYSTYLGGSTAEKAGGIAVDSNGVGYVDGGTSSSDFPTTASAFQTTNPGTSAFFTKLKADGTGLLYSTFLRGSGGSQASAIAIDTTTAAYLTGIGFTGFPTTAGAFQPNVDPFTLDCNFVAKFDAAQNLAYSTCLGRAGLDAFFKRIGPAGIAVDAAGAAYVVGDTADNLFPTLNPIEPSPANPFFAAIFATKLNSTGTALLYSTFVATNTEASGIALDSQHNLYITGQNLFQDPTSPLPVLNTVPDTVPTTGSAFQPIPQPPDPLAGFGFSSGPHVFVAKIADSLGAAVPIPVPRRVIFSTPINVGNTSATQAVVFGNYGDASLAFSNVTFSGAAAADFLQTNSCLSAIAGGTDCTVSVSFRPTAGGVRNATMSINLGGGLPSQTVALQGTALAPTFTASPNPLDLGFGVVGVPLGSPGCCATGNVTIANGGTAILNINSVAVTSGFHVGASTTPPVIPNNIQPGQSGDITIAFVPVVAGPQVGTLTVQDNAPGNPHQVQVKGTGVASGDFAVENSGSSSATVAAGQTATYKIRVVAATGFNSGITVSCSGLPSGASCSSPSNGTMVTGPTLTDLTLSVATTARTTASFRQIDPRLWLGLVAALSIVATRSRRSRALSLAVCTLVVALGMISCGGGGNGNGGGGGGGTPSGAFSFTATVSAGTTSRSTSLTLNVQ